MLPHCVLARSVAKGGRGTQHIGPQSHPLPYALEGLQRPVEAWQGGAAKELGNLSVASLVKLFKFLRVVCSA